MPTADAPLRLLSPMRRRIYPNPTSHNGTGDVEVETWSALVRGGWKEYRGPATTDGRGWVVGGTDPAVVPAGPNEQWR